MGYSRKNPSQTGDSGAGDMEEHGSSRDHLKKNLNFHRNEKKKVMWND